MRKEIEIWAMVAEQDWRLLDTENGMSLSFDFASNILNDVGNITSSRTFTIKLPRTTNNDTILDFATVPEYESSKRYANIPCRIYVNGVDITGTAHLYILASEAGVYECCVVFGLMQNYKAWIDAGKKLNELTDDGDYIDWSWKAAYIFTPEIGSPHDPTQAIWDSGRMHYGVYDPGFTRDDYTIGYANVHPFVTVDKVLAIVFEQNNLSVNVPEYVQDDMANLALLLTKIKGNTPNGIPENHTLETDGEIGGLVQIGNYYYFRPHFAEDGYIEELGNMSYKVKSRGDGPVRLTFHMKLTGQSVEWAMARLGNDTSKIRLLSTDLVAGTTSYIEPLYIFDTYEQEWILQYFGVLDFVGSDEYGVDIGALQFRVPKVFGGYDNFYNYFINMRVSNAAGSPQFPQPPEKVVSVTWYSGTYDYPNPEFRLFPNLPDVKQVDFLKFVCNLYGLFAVVNNQNPDQIDLVPISVLEENKANAYDWSGLLDNAERDTPRKTAFDIGLAKRNRIAWKEDEKDSFVSEAFIESNGAANEREKDMFILPFAATEENTVPQYRLTLNEDGINYDVEANECEYRIMRVTQWYPTGKMTKLSFVNLSAEYIANVTYAEWQSYVLNPVVITERVRLRETDLAEIDMTRPVFIAKYGRHFAIKDIKWTVGNAYAECELLML